MLNKPANSSYARPHLGTSAFITGFDGYMIDALEAAALMGEVDNMGKQVHTVHPSIQ